MRICILIWSGIGIKNNSMSIQSMMFCLPVVWSCRFGSTVAEKDHYVKKVNRILNTALFKK